MEFFQQEYSAFEKCYTQRRAVDPTSALSFQRLLQTFLDLIFCSKSNAFAASFLLCLLIAFGAYTLSKITKNDSWIDRGWSMFPVWHAWVYYYIPNSTDTNGAQRADGVITAKLLFAFVILLWGSRMTFNFYRRGGYSYGGEDYRWEIVRKFDMFTHPKFGKIVWELFSFFFISLFQSVLLWAETLPLLVLPSNSAGAATSIHWMIAGAFLVMLLVETVADEQQWIFQNGKYRTGPRYASLESDYKRGFLTQGLFAYTRHPNVFAEQSMWVIIYTLSISSWGLLNISGLGALSLVILTIRSCILTEEISCTKYPEYKRYQEKSNSLVPSRIPARF